jgi:hypothetical protein
MHYRLTRTGRQMILDISADRRLGAVAVRLGPFESQPRASDVLLNGQHPAESVIAKSGDSWWVSFTAQVGPISSAGGH